MPVIAGGAVAGGITIAIVFIVVVVILRKFKKPGKKKMYDK